MDFLQVSNSHYKQGDENLIVEFYADHEEAVFETQKSKKGPVFKKYDYCKIMVPGQPHSTVVHRLKEDDMDPHKMRFATRWKAYKDNEEYVPEGTPVKEWPVVTTGQVKHLNSLKIFTVEQLASSGEVIVKQLGNGGYRLRELAKAYVDQDSKNGRKIEELEAQIAEMTNLLKSKVVKKGTKKAAPSKAKENTEEETNDTTDNDTISS